MNKKKRLIVISCYVIGTILLVISLIIPNSPLKNILDKDEVKIELNKNTKIRIKDIKDKATFKFTPEKTGYYRHISYDNENEEAELLIEDEDGIEVDYDFYINDGIAYLEKGNTYSYTYKTYDAPCDVYLEIKKIDSKTITDDKEVTINKDTLLLYDSKKRATKAVEVNGKEDYDIDVSEAEDMTFEGAINKTRITFEARKDQEYSILVTGVTKDAKVTISDYYKNR